MEAMGIDSKAKGLCMKKNEIDEIEKIQLKGNMNIIDYSKNMQMYRKQVELCGKENYVLDIGCHDGTITQKIAKKGNKVEGLELDKKKAAIARKKGFKVYIGKVQKIPAESNKYDVVHMSEVIEHFLETEKALKEIHRVLKPNGRLIITTPNTTSFRDRVLVLFGKLPAYVSHEEHVKFFNVNRLKNYLKKSNFNFEKAYGSGFVIPIPVIARKYFYFLDSVLPASFMERLIVTAKAIKKGEIKKLKGSHG